MPIDVDMRWFDGRRVKAQGVIDDFLKMTSLMTSQPIINTVTSTMPTDVDMRWFD